MQECVFCKIIQGEIPAEVVYEDEYVVAFKDIHPAAPVHLLLVPKKHIPTFFDIEKEDEAILGRLQLAAGRVAQKLGLEKGFRMVGNCGEDAGQLVFHIHYHLLGGRTLQWPPG
ncbi:HIT domain-containing protein [Desulfofundulus thermobenzoicus]|uniref:HIT domain-containing protein n=1 Tax=Desulfofundulus thermobenzoicus TaxID=29376 RepID=A0A6N7INV9_9FIRM|nr:HIT domain-containing protein [Desulfofundulus thermobenzoicus]HHW43218.1 histidine triad nucleotide-binding protein [Desulfotomaculum sp.]